jgi:filamentous hemagglutinin
LPYGEPVAAIDDAWAIGQRLGIKPERVGNVDIYLIPRPNSGYAGGFSGQLQNLDTVTIITQGGTNKIITGFPGNGLPLPKP